MNKDIKLENTTEPIVKQKRGRKSKKEIQLANEQKLNQELASKMATAENNITCSIQEISGTNENVNENPNEISFINENEESNEIVQKPGAKKRGRKPKGGKIIQQSIQLNNNKDLKPNIILHLKCSLKDLQINTLLSSNVESFNFSESNPQT